MSEMSDKPRLLSNNYDMQVKRLNAIKTAIDIVNGLNRLNISDRPEIQNMKLDLLRRAKNEYMELYHDD